MTTQPEDLGAQLEALAVALAKDLAMDGVMPKDRLDGLKVLTTYYAATRKLKLKDADEDEGAFSFGKVAAQLKAVS